MKLISLDIEATDNGEMLELSICRVEDNMEIYHSYFKPVRARTWSNIAHHITPDMVKDAPSCKDERPRIQRILDEADGIVGFALHNDVRYLETHDIKVPAKALRLEVQEWFWLHVGRREGMAFGAVPRLSKCAELLGFEFSEETDAHSATNDTHMTIDLFKRILHRAGIAGISRQAIDEFNEVYGKERELHAERMAKGILSLVEGPKGYTLRNNSAEAEMRDLSIAVDSRFLAEHELRERFRKRETEPDSRIYRLRPADIEFFRSYTNVYDASKEEFYRMIYNARKSRGKRLSFNLR